MLVAPHTVDEDARIQLLRMLQLLDSPAEPVFDRITSLAARALGMPIALISLIDRERQWFKSCIGLDATETPREYAFCAHAIHGEQPLVVEDARADCRFAENPLVTGEPRVRFYAGVPLRSRDGIALGTLCMIDRVPRRLDAGQLQMLVDFGDLVRREILHRETAALSRDVHRRSLRAAEQSEAYMRASFEQAAVGIAIVGPDGHWTQVNDKLCAIVGYSPAELVTMTFQDITHADDLDSDLHLVARFLAGEIDSHTFEKRYVRRDGSVIWVNLTVSLMRDSSGAPLYFICIVEDIHARKQAEAALAGLHRELEARVDERTRQLRKANGLLLRSAEQQRLSEQSLRLREAQLAAVLEHAHDAYLAIDRDGVIAQWNRQAELMLGWTRAESIGRRFDNILRAHAHHAEWDATCSTLLCGGGPVQSSALELDVMHRDGRVFPAELRISPLPPGSGYAFCVFLQDITPRRQLEQSLQLRATRDVLTGLPNRAALLEKLEATVQRAARSQQPFGVLFLDLDGFKAINDNHGHAGGDAVLQAFAQRLRQCVRKTDTVARLAGDEFVVLLEALPNPDDAEQVAQKILHALAQPFSLQGAPCRMSTSIGIYIHRAGGDASADSVLREADAAMYRAKRAGKNRLQLAASA